MSDDDTPNIGGDDVPDPSTDGPDATTDEAAVAPVTRDGARAAADSRRNRKMAIIAGLVALAVLGGGALVFALTSSDDPAPTTTTTTTSTTVAPTTTVPVPVGPIAPLTGVQLAVDDAAGAALLNRPALVAKVDNAPEAMPQIGLQYADMVIEIEVEGISRYMSIFQSKDVQQVGPIRSARTSDPDLLAMFVRPLVAWSGGNRNVTGIMDATPWIQNLTPTQAPNAYSRTRSKSAPHNLVLDVPTVYSYADQPPAVPTQLFNYLAPGQDPGGFPVLGFSVRVGTSPSSFAWDGIAGNWPRFANGRRHLDEDGNQLAPTNVIVLETTYRPSDADSRSPEAVTIGGGSATVFTQGRVIAGSWQRDAPEQPWRLTGLDGQPILLTPGPTWVELPQTGQPAQLLDEPTVAGLQTL